MIKALIFDFDGLLVDTETPSFESWRAVYAEYGYPFTLELWQGALGTTHGFDALAHLGTLVSESFDPVATFAKRLAHKTALAMQQPLLPGVISLLAEAKAQGMPCAVASSSDRAWVVGWLEHHNLLSSFQCVRTADDVALTKPAPDLFLAAAACLAAEPGACLVFEDSPNGILAAQAAGMRCVAVPGAITSQLTLPPADLVLPSLDALPLADILAHFQ
ncbi:MAG: HAD-IA family hydrolase [Herpetosiphonaceae bacterium]|nr:HAD-IA family hydrolase [Herpetosiphonaceae bacterium]